MKRAHSDIHLKELYLYVRIVKLYKPSNESN